jgi:tRNA U34 2-thiouridine synthase MnmA/TrmU
MVPHYFKAGNINERFITSTKAVSTSYGTALHQKPNSKELCFFESKSSGKFSNTNRARYTKGIPPYRKQVYFPPLITTACL